MTFGRGPACDIGLSDDPHLSRRAGALLGQDGYLLIRNDSTSKPIVLRPPAGEDRVIEPAAATTSLPLRHFDLVLYGAGGAAVMLAVDAGPPWPAPAYLAGGGTASTVTTPLSLTPTQRCVLLALCEPMLTLRGPAARPATYAEIGQRIGLRRGYVRNVVKALRESLTAHGLAGLSEDAHDATVVKMLFPREGSDANWPGESELRRWHDNATLLRHPAQPHVVQLHDIFGGDAPHAKGAPGSGRPLAYLTMAWVEGPTMAEHLRGRPVTGATLVERLQYIDDLATAVASLHSTTRSAGNPVLHRDLTPANCMVPWINLAGQLSELLEQAGAGSAAAAAAHLLGLMHPDPAARPNDVLAWSRTLTALAARRTRKASRSRSGCRERGVGPVRGGPSRWCRRRRVGHRRRHHASRSA